MIPLVSNAVPLANGGNDLAHQPEKARLAALDENEAFIPDMTTSLS